MPTQKPRITITMSSEQLSKIEDYRFDKKFKNQTQAILSLIESGLAELSSDIKEPASISADELSKDAIKVGIAYDDAEDAIQFCVRKLLDLSGNVIPIYGEDRSLVARGGKTVKATGTPTAAELKRLDDETEALAQKQAADELDG